jgi:putative tricarboxylic transport membrane protein
MADRVIFVCTLILAGIYFYATEKLPSLEIGDPLGPKAFPRLLTIGLLITGGVLLLEIVRARKKPAPAAKAAEERTDPHVYLVIAGAIVWTFLYFLVFEWLGFMIATSLYLLGLTSYFHRGKWLANVLSSVGFAVGSYFLFQVLGVNLAPGTILPL